MTVVKRRCGKWDRLATLLDLSLAGHSTVATTARRAVGEWIENVNRSATSPTEEEVQRIRMLVQRCEATLPGDWVNQIRFFVGRFSE